MEEDAELGVLEMATRLKVLLCGLIVLCRLRRGSRQRKCEKHRCQKFSHIFFSCFGFNTQKIWFLCKSKHKTAKNLRFFYKKLFT